MFSRKYSLWGERVAYTVKKFGDYRERRSYAKTKNAIELNNLLEIQKKSYDWFMTEGIKEVFDDIFPVESFTGNLTLEFGEYSFEEPRYSIKGCKDRYATYAAPLKVEARLFNQETGEVKEQDIYLGDMPIMTDSGTFIINGAERVIVSQLVRSPSVYFSREVDKKNGKHIITSQIIPTRGTWLEYETDARDVIYCRIDRTRKVPVTTLLRALGLSSDNDIVDLFGEDDYILRTIEKDTNKNTDESLIDIHSKLRPGEPSTLDSAKNQLISRFFDAFRYDLAKVGRYKFNRKLSVVDRLFDTILAEDIKKLFTTSPLVMTKRSKSGDREVDIIPFINSIDARYSDEDKLIKINAVLSAGSDNFLNPEMLVGGMKIILKLFDNAKGIFGVEDNKPDAIAKLRELTKDEPRMEVMALKTKYPQGAERQLIFATTGRAINSAMLPADAGCVVDNVETIINVYRAVAEGKPSMERVVTVSGDAVNEPGNFKVLFGTNQAELVEAAGGFKEEPEKMISGGPMMGFSMFTLDVPVTKTSSSILCFTKDEVAKYEPSACINCGRCVDACPSRLIPSRLADLAERHDEESFTKMEGME